MCNPFKAFTRALGIGDDTVNQDSGRSDAAAAAAAAAPPPVAKPAAAVLKTAVPDAVADQAARDARRRGRQSTILTGGLGDPNYGSAVSTNPLQATYLGI